jgi:hypothetical protein
MKRFLLVREKRSGIVTGPTHSDVSFAVNPQIVLSNLLPIVHHNPRSAIRIHSGRPSRRTRGRCGGCRARLPLPFVRTAPQFVPVLYLSDFFVATPNRRVLSVELSWRGNKVVERMWCMMATSLNAQPKFGRKVASLIPFRLEES